MHFRDAIQRVRRNASPVIVMFANTTRGQTVYSDDVRLTAC